MGEAIEISWTDGPSEKRVQEISNAFKDVSRDGFGEILSGGNRYVGLDRSFSKSATTWATEQAQKTYGADANESRRILARTSFDANGRPHTAAR